MSDTWIHFALFGFWSLLCVLCGAWLMHRKQRGRSPVPPMFERLEQIVHATMGKSDDAPDARAPKPPYPGMKRKPERDRARV